MFDKIYWKSLIGSGCIMLLFGSGIILITNCETNFFLKLIGYFNYFSGAFFIWFLAYETLKK